MRGGSGAGHDLGSVECVHHTLALSSTQSREGEEPGAGRGGDERRRGDTSLSRCCPLLALSSLGLGGEGAQPPTLPRRMWPSSGAP